MSALSASRPLNTVYTVNTLDTTTPLDATLHNEMHLTQPPSPDSCYSPLPSLTHSLPSSSSSSIHSVPDSIQRINEHLAVLLPKQLWKPDAGAAKCDNFYCSVLFSVFDRRHHCRKCGGVYCASCTSRSTPLLDTSNLPFLHPPRNTPLASLASPDAPLRPCRVCDDCWDQIHGNPSGSSPRTPELATRPLLAKMLSSPISMLKSPLHSSSLSASSSSASLSSTSSEPHPLAASDPLLAPMTRKHKTRSLRSPSPKMLIRTAHLALPAALERSYGELDAYPLRHSSVLCKATGGGRWEPKHEPPLVGYRLPVPGAKAQFELDMERAELAERLRKDNPVVKDGDFQYRLCGRRALSTF